MTSTVFPHHAPPFAQPGNNAASRGPTPTANDSLGALDCFSTDLQEALVAKFAHEPGSLRSFADTCHAARALTARFAEHALTVEVASSRRASTQAPRPPMLSHDALDACSLLVMSRARRAPTTRELLQAWAEVESARGADAALAVERIARAVVTRSRVLNLSGLRLTSFPTRVTLGFVRYVNLAGNAMATANLSVLPNVRQLDVGDTVVRVKVAIAGVQYKGDWQHRGMHGQGSAVYCSGDRYAGEWKDGTLHGKGVVVYQNGDRYEGEFHTGRREGRGTMTFVSGDKYVGEWHDHVIHGLGLMTSSDGSQYEGAWRAWKPHGKGDFMKSDGTGYKGEWVNGLPNGQGVQLQPDDTWYDGAWKDGWPHGAGTMIYPDGTRRRGEWRRGHYLDSEAKPKASRIPIATSRLKRDEASRS